MEVRMQFWNRFESLCQKNGEKPTPLVKKLGIPAGSVTSWKNGSVPHHGTLLKIADYFGVTVDYLLGNEEKEKALPSPAQSLNETEAELVKAFRAASPETQDAVLRVLQINTGRTQRKDA